MVNLKNIDLYSTKNEKKLYEIWAEVLSNEDIKPDDKFFEIGGNSLTAMMMIEKIKQAFNCELNAAQLLECNTISDLCKLIYSNKSLN